MSYDFLNYNVIGGHYDGMFIPCVIGAGESYSMFDKKHRQFLYEMMAVACDLGGRLINDVQNILDFCEMKEFETRHIRPKPTDDEATLLHFLGIRIFSTESRENDNQATVNGRVLEFFWRENIGASQVIEYLRNNGGIHGVYDQVVKKYPRRPNKKKRHKASEKGATDQHTSTSQTAMLALYPHPESHGVNAENCLDIGETGNPQIVEVEASITELTRLLRLSNGEKISAVIECVGWHGGWVMLKFSKIRDYPVVINRMKA